MINFGIIGAGWRSEFYIRIANALPQLFNVTGVYIRNAQKAEVFSKKHNVRVFTDLESLIAANPDFTVLCVDNNSIAEQTVSLCEKNIALLIETPAGTSFEQINNLRNSYKPDWRVQVAEQYHLQPRNAAIKKIIESGIIGNVVQAQVACCHDYHAVSLIRFFMDIGNELPKVKSVSIDDPLFVYDGRDGVFPPKETVSKQKIAVLDYGGRFAVYDFTSEQYFSAIRNTRILIRGTKGEILNGECTYLDGNRPVNFNINREMYGSYENLDGLCLARITGNGKVLYENPFTAARFSDEEIAVATVLVKMDEYLKTGKPFYSLHDAITDAETALYF